MGEISTSIHRNAKQKNDLVSIENDGEGICLKLTKKYNSTGPRLWTDWMFKIVALKEDERRAPEIL